MKKLTAFLMMFAMVATMGAFAQDAEVVVEENKKDAWIPGISLSVDWASRYMSDGVVVNPDPCAFLDASASWDFGLYLEVWAAMDLNHFNQPDHGSYSYKNNRRGRAEEIDYVIGYSYTTDKIFDFSDVTFDLSWKYFQYPRAFFGHDNPFDTTISLDNLFKNNENLQDHSLKVAATWRYDLEHYTNYGWLEVAYGYNFTEKLSGGVSTKVFYCGQQKAKNSFGVHHDCFSTLEVKTSLGYAITDNLSASTFVDCGWGLEKGCRDTMKDSYCNNALNIRYGAGMSYSF